jgi:glucose-6-phosphate 1-dehydrogenase
MFQNHLLQLLSLVAMEPPGSPDPDDFRDEKLKVLRAVRPIRLEEIAQATLRGQYRGYREEPGIAASSSTATYAAIRFYIDNWRWEGVPFYLRSGKRLADKCTEIVAQFKRPPLPMFPREAVRSITPNMIALCLQPDEGIHERFEAKVPDTQAETRSVDMEFHYRTSFGPMSIPEAYERLLLDALHGDPSLFTRGDRSELAWTLLDPILQVWEEQDVPPLHIYEPGSWGPEEADHMLAGEGRTWMRACGGHNIPA